MASWIPSEIFTSLSASDSGLGEIFTNVENVVQTVGSIYDQVTGKSQGVPGQSAQITTPSPTVAAPAPAPAQAQATLVNSGIALGIGAVVLIGALLLLKD